jgi:hypothetical protein
MGLASLDFPGPVRFRIPLVQGMTILRWTRVVQVEDEGALLGRSPSQALSKLTARLGQRLKHFSHDNLILLNSLTQGEGGVLTPSQPSNPDHATARGLITPFLDGHVEIMKNSEIPTSSTNVFWTGQN